jgi:hypothetical protein
MTSLAPFIREVATEAMKLNRSSRLAASRLACRGAERSVSLDPPPRQPQAACAQTGAGSAVANV